jgi:predicted RecA/RadA family phage recombinase
MKNFVQEGKTLDFTAAADFEGDDFVKIGSAIGVVGADVKTGQIGQLTVEGVFTVKKLAHATDQALAQFEMVYIDATNKQVTKTASGNTKAGYATVAAASTDTTATIRLVAMI